MKQCSTCREEFADKFSFCPVDGTPLYEFAEVAPTVASPEQPQEFYTPPPATQNFAANSSDTWQAPAQAASSTPAHANEYHLTFVDDTGLTRRVFSELKGVAQNAELTWPEFKRDPFGYTGRFFKAYSLLVWRFFTSRNVAIATSIALFVVTSAVIAVIAFGKKDDEEKTLLVEKDMNLEQLLTEEEIPAEIEETKPDKGIGTGEGGRVGFNKGRGEGSKPKFEKAGGGGGGGQQDVLPAQVGKIPPPSIIPGKIPTTPPTTTPLLPTAGVDIDPALYRNLPYDRFGDPRSTSTATSAGPGTGNGIGSGTGAGIGEGEGVGVGKGRGRNMGGGDPNDGGGGIGGGRGNNGEDLNRIFNPKEVTQKARILSRPEPQYTEDARKNQVSGTVVLRAVFSSSGQVTNIRTVSGLPYGLTERAIAAARQIRFSPAMKDGRAVSQYIQIEYNFNLY
ncbi:MAG TPA: energy transducer TonB [Pyrinomonadaceae bacterium]